MDHAMITAHARAFLALPSAALLVLDTTGVNSDADIIRIVLADVQGNRLLDQLIQPGRHRGEANTTYTGISAATLSQMPTFTEVWPTIWQVLQSRYILAYGLMFALARLNENVGAYRMADRNLEPAPPLPLIGSDLMTMTQDYYGSGRSIKLALAARYLGLPTRDPMLAEDRIMVQVKLLEQMAGCVVQINPDEPDDDESPF